MVDLPKSMSIMSTFNVAEICPFYMDDEPLCFGNNSGSSFFQDWETDADVLAEEFLEWSTKVKSNKRANRGIWYFEPLRYYEESLSLVCYLK